jgi:type II secretory pathway component PulJ
MLLEHVAGNALDAASLPTQETAMTERTLALSKKHMLEEATPRWDVALQRLQARRDQLQQELIQANQDIAHHIYRKHQWVEHVADALSKVGLDPWRPPSGMG